MSVRHSNRYLWLGLLGGGVVIAAYCYIYLGRPLPGAGNETLETLLISLAALGSAAMATLVWRHFPAADRGPRGVWGNFAIAFWLWAIAETIIFGYCLLSLTPPTLSPADAFWLVGYVFFASALIHQYRLIYRSTRRQEVRLTLGVVGGSLVVSLSLAALIQLFFRSETTWLEDFVYALYPILDLALGFAAFRLVYAFGGKLWSRPWMGLFVFAVADGAYAWLILIGVYASLVTSGNPLGLAVDLIYVSAYLVVTLACLSQLLLLQYGLPRATMPEPESIA